MSAIILHRTDPAKNMRRFYRLAVQPDLFGQWCFIREWGRLGRAGRSAGGIGSDKLKAEVASGFPARNELTAELQGTSVSMRPALTLPSAGLNAKQSPERSSVV